MATYLQLSSQGLPEKSFVDKENIQLKQNSLNPREDAWSQESLELSPVLAWGEAEVEGSCFKPSRIKEIDLALL